MTSYLALGSPEGSDRHPSHRFPTLSQEAHGPDPLPKERADRTFSYGHDPQIMLDPSWFPHSLSDSGNDYYYLV